MKAITENPYFVLALPWDAPRALIEREAQKWLGMLALAFAEAARYETPLGPQTRTADVVRTAVAQLRDPASKVMAQLWAAHATIAAPAIRQETTQPRETHADLASKLGWQRQGDS